MDMSFFDGMLLPQVVAACQLFAVIGTIVVRLQWSIKIAQLRSWQISSKQMLFLFSWQ